MTIPEVSQPTKECPHPERWSCHDGYTTEVEVLHFLEALVIMLKPEVIVETGSYVGLGTWHLATPRIGIVHTAELNPEYQQETITRCVGLNVRSYLMAGDRMIEQLEGPIDLAFLDSGMDGSRENELKAVRGKLSPGALVLVHDTNSGGHLGHRLHIFEVAESLGFNRIQCNTPRGLTLLQARDGV